MSKTLARVSAGLSRLSHKKKVVSDLEMISWFKVDAFQMIFKTLTLTETPKSAEDIETKTNLGPCNIADSLEIMERYDIAEFSDKKCRKWQATRKGKEIYKKYFL